MNFEGSLEILGPAGRIVVAGRGACVRVSAGWRTLIWALPRRRLLITALRFVPVRTDLFLRSIWIASALPVIGGRGRLVFFPQLFGITNRK